MDTAEVQRRMSQLDNDMRETLMIVHDIEDTQRTHGQQLARVNGVLDEHSRTLEEHSRRLDEHSRILNEHGEALQTLNAKVDGLDAKVDGLDAKVDGLDAKVDTVIGLLQDGRRADGP
jgi:chromosome segregation ATPase